ncbi:MAG: hypothetical protein IIA48_10700 [Bacteroidetes bacterium]|nr:hypothetical protein [Bacteroidota bacterium]
MITITESNLYWNFFLALEKDLNNVSRYIEFSESNWDTYSIELVRLLLTVSSEVDVLLKELCLLLDTNSNANNINDYKTRIKSKLPAFIEEKVFINRYGLNFKPWSNWRGNDNPIWWCSYNHVKHKRNQFYKDANLKNILNAFGALLITNLYYYKAKFEKEENTIFICRDVMRKLQPESELLTLNGDYYYSTLIV